MYNRNPFFRPPNLRSLLSHFFKNSALLNKLVIINVSVYVGFLLLKLGLSLFAFLLDNNVDTIVLEAIVRYLSVPASFQLFLWQPWSIITSLFFHISFWHIFVNMLMLIVAGRIFGNYLSDKKLLIVYLVGGIVGNLFYQLAYQTLPVFQSVVMESYAMGASGSIMAIFAAITLHKPQHELYLIFLGKVKLKWIMLFFILIDIISIPKGNAGGHIAHLGGAIFGALYIFFAHYTLKWKNKSKKKKKFYTSYTTSQGRPLSDEEYNGQKQKQHEALDKILDKISKNGYDSLSREEKDFLFFHSKK